MSKYTEINARRSLLHKYLGIAKEEGVDVPGYEDEGRLHPEYREKLIAKWRKRKQRNAHN